MARLIRTFEVEIETDISGPGVETLPDQTIIDEIRSALESAWPYAVTVHSVKIVSATVAKRPNSYLPARHPRSPHHKGA